MALGERRKREILRRRDDILDVAVEMFDERREWQGVTIEEIAERAEIGKGTVYKHFRSKEELYAAVAGRVQQRIAARVARLEDSLTPAEAVAVLVRIYWDEYRALSPGTFRVVDYCDQAGFGDSLDAGVRVDLAAADTAFTAAATGIVSRGIADGIFARRPVPRTVFLVQSTVIGAVRLAGRERVPPDESADYRDALVLYLLDGLMDNAPPAPDRTQRPRA